MMRSFLERALTILHPIMRKLRPTRLSMQCKQKMGKDRRSRCNGNQHQAPLRRWNNHVDGTFQTCPRLFYQVFTLHAFKNGRQFPLVYARLPNKTRATYEIVLELVKQKAQDIHFHRATDRPVSFRVGYQAGCRAELSHDRVQKLLPPISQALMGNSKPFDYRLPTEKMTMSTGSYEELLLWTLYQSGLYTWQSKPPPHNCPTSTTLSSSSRTHGWWETSLEPVECFRERVQQDKQQLGGLAQPLKASGWQTTPEHTSLWKSSRESKQRLRYLCPRLNLEHSSLPSTDGLNRDRKITQLKESFEGNSIASMYVVCLHTRTSEAHYTVNIKVIMLTKTF